MVKTRLTATASNMLPTTARATAECVSYLFIEHILTLFEG